MNKIAELKQRAEHCKKGNLQLIISSQDIINLCDALEEVKKMRNVLAKNLEDAEFNSVKTIAFAQRNCLDKILSRIDQILER